MGRRSQARIAFTVSGYDSARPLVVDPILNYSTYLSGSAGDDNQALGIAADSNGHAFVVGTTLSTDFPTTASAFKGAPPTTTPPVFVSEFNPTGTSLLYSTYLGDSGEGFGLSVGLDSSGNVYVTGQTFSTNFPTTSSNAVIPSLSSNPNGTAFLSKINPSASGTSSLVCSSYFGGSNGDFANGIVADSNQIAYIAGLTISAPSALGSGGFMTKNALPLAPATPFQGSLKGPSDAFVAKLPLVPTVSVSPTTIDFGTQIIGATTPAQIVTLTNNTDSAVAISSIAVVSISGPATDFPIGTNTCGNSLAAESPCTVRVAYMPSVSGPESASLDFSFTDPVTRKPAVLQVSLSGTGSSAGPAASFSPTSLQPFGDQLLTTTSSAQMVKITNNGTATLMNIAISISGDFGQTNTCGASLNVGAN